MSWMTMAAQEVRHASDYDDFYIAGYEESKEQVETACEVIEMISEYLDQKLNDKK